MKNRRSTPLQVLALCDFGMVAMACGVVLWHWTSRHLPLWLELLLLTVVFMLRRLYKRRFAAMTRLGRRVARSLSLPERRVRYHWVCVQFALTAMIIAWAIPFPFATAAFWCIYVTALIVLVALLDAARQQLFRVA